jgi:hypothetical protein
MFQTHVIRDNRGNDIDVRDFAERGSVCLYDNKFGIDTNPATKGLMSKTTCEGCGNEDKNCRMCSGCRRVVYCGGDCQHAHWQQHKENCTVSVEVIFTYDYRGDHGQDIYNVFLNANISEENFVKSILDTIPLHADNLHDLHHLIRLSTATDGDFMSFRHKNKGKYFFSQRIYPTPYTKQWQKYLRNYILSRE